MLESLWSPKSVAVIGASRNPGKVGHEIVANLRQGGFTGTIVPVNPSAETILGLPCYPDLKSYGQPVELSVVVVPLPAVYAAVEDSIAAGAGAVVVITAGFKETGPEGAAREKEIAQLCARHGVRLLGPNCLGLINTHHRMNASFAPEMPTPSNISVFSQSGALATAILDWSAARGLGFAKLISIGNKADLDETDFLRALAQDDQTSVIVAYLESITSGDTFIRAAEEAASVKPVVVLRSGTMAAGTRAASSHTGSLAGADIAYGAAFKRAGVIRADTFEALFDYATALAMQPVPTGDRVAIITNAGGPGIMAADAVENAGLHVATLTKSSAESLKQKLPPAASVANPIDVLGDAQPEQYIAALAAAQDDPAVDAVIIILTPQAITKCRQTAEAIVQCHNGKKPVLACFMGGKDVQEARAVLVQNNLPDYPAPERAVEALRAMCEYGVWRRRPPRVVKHFPVNRRRAARVIRRHQRLGQCHVGEAKAKEILRAYDFNVPPGEPAATVDDALEVAERIGYPVAMKIMSPDILHKSDLGGVKLNLGDEYALRDAYDLMMLRIGQKMPHARLQGVYIEKMCRRGREVILGMTRDPSFGPMLMFGLGGIFVEVMKDVTFYLAPITSDEAMQMLRGTRSYKLLTGVRGEHAVDLGAIADGIQRISQLVTDFPQIMELDINPFIVGEIGTEPVAADARITLAARDHEASVPGRP